MGKKWKRLLVQRRRNGRIEMPTERPKPAVSNSEMIERMEAAAPAPVLEPEVIEEAPVVEAESAAEETAEEEAVAEAPKPKRRRRTTRRKKTVSEG